MSTNDTNTTTTDPTTYGINPNVGTYMAYHKAMVGELFIVFLLYLVFSFKFPKKYVNAEESGEGQQGQGPDNRAPADPVPSSNNDLSSMTNQLLILFAHHTIGVGSAFFSPYTFQLVITWLHLPFVILYVLLSNKDKVTLSNIMLIIIFFIDLALILSGLIERGGGTMFFQGQVYNPYDD